MDDATRTEVSRFIVTFFSLVVTIGSMYYLFRPEEPTASEPRIIPTEGGLGMSQEDKREMFIPTNEWKTVQDNHICPAGLEYRLNMTDGTKLARLLQ